MSNDLGSNVMETLGTTGFLKISYFEKMTSIVEMLGSIIRAVGRLIKGINN